MKRFLIVTIVLAAAWPALSQQSPPSAHRPSAVHGREVFLSLGCYTCHGTVGQGGAGATLAPNTLPLAGFAAWVRNGTPGWSVANGMPSFSQRVVSDDDLADVREYLATLPAPRPAKDIPLLND
jgi:mono/diheme cytochrome c family protein